MTRIPRKGSYAADETAKIIAQRNAKFTARMMANGEADDAADRNYSGDDYPPRRRTVKPTRKSTVRETVTLETKPAKVLSFAEGRKAARRARKNRAKDYSWLMADVLSTPSGYRA